MTKKGPTKTFVFTVVCHVYRDGERKRGVLIIVLDGIFIWDIEDEVSY